jgi:hypothetical protein
MVPGLKKRFGKSPVWPALLSALVAPGVGQFANREYLKGGVLLFASIASFLWFSRAVTEALSALLPGTPDQWKLNQDQFREAVVKIVGQNPSMFVTFEILILLVWIFGIVDAYITARQLSRLPAKGGADAADDADR